MTYPVEFILSHIDFLISRQQENLDELVLDKPKPITQITRAKNKLHVLRSFRKNLALGNNVDQKVLNSIELDMKELGW